MNYRKTSHPEYFRWRKIFTRYGLTKDQYEKKLIKQNNTCALCKCEIIVGLNYFSKDYPQIDHDHSTGATRDFLCKSCNTSLGHFESGMKRWPSFFYYVIKHKIKYYLNIYNPKASKVAKNQRL